MTAQAFRNPAPTLRELCGKEPWHFLSTTSKGFGLIQRFSEDIDLSLAREDLGFGGGEDPAAKGSRKGRQKAVTAPATAEGVHVQVVLVPKLRENFTRALAQPFDIELAESSSESKVLFYYPAAFDFAAYGGRYIKPVVLLELAARSDHDPTRDVNITSYAAVHFPNEFKEAPCAMLAQAPERTLLEKALILHSAIHKKRIADRVSRHAYDLVMLSRDAGTMSRVTRKLFEQVARHKFVFADGKYASEAPTVGINLVPRDAGLLREFENDYRSKNEMFFAEPEPFAVIAGELERLETLLHSLTRE